MQRAIRRAMLYLVVAGLLMTLVATAVTLWMLRRHLMLFLKAVHRLAAGMWEARVPYPACDEFGILARAFNLMADQLQSAFEQQEEQRNEIEKQKTELEQLYEQLQQAYQALETANQELVAMNALLSQAAITDGLTGLRNHRAFQESLMNLVQMAERYGQPLSLIMLDIDYFKQFNDRFGHPAGDELLRQVASLLRRSARAYDVVARYGGEEFAILLPNTDLNEAVRVAERLRQQIEALPNPMRLSPPALEWLPIGMAARQRRSCTRRTPPCMKPSGAVATVSMWQVRMTCLLWDERYTQCGSIGSGRWARYLRASCGVIEGFLCDSPNSLSIL
jgi:diguanylate cyclase (GGDEF)-like protein